MIVPQKPRAVQKKQRRASFLANDTLNEKLKEFIKNAINDIKGLDNNHIFHITRAISANFDDIYDLHDTVQNKTFDDRITSIFLEFPVSVEDDESIKNFIIDQKNTIISNLRKKLLKWWMDEEPHQDEYINLSLLLYQMNIEQPFKPDEFTKILKAYKNTRRISSLYLKGIPPQNAQEILSKLKPTLTPNTSEVPVKVNGITLKNQLIKMKKALYNGDTIAYQQMWNTCALALNMMQNYIANANAMLTNVLRSSIQQLLSEGIIKLVKPIPSLKQRLNNRTAASSGGGQYKPKESDRSARRKVSKKGSKRSRRRSRKVSRRRSRKKASKKSRRRSRKKISKKGSKKALKRSRRRSRRRKQSKH